MRVIAIDGPAAAGKGTLARRLAEYFGLPYLDTGLLYRAVGRRMLDRGADPADAQVAAEEARALTPGDLQRGDLRDMQAAAAASVVASNPAVRAALLAFQRDFGSRGGAILDGRDIGTVIVPDAPVKLYVTASPEARGMRRYREILAAGGAGDLAAITDEVRARDAADAARAAAPMKPAEDAVLIDTTDLTPDAAFERALDVAKARLPAA